MKKIVKITKPTLTSAQTLTPLQMNAIHFGGTHTVVTRPPQNP